MEFIIIQGYNTNGQGGSIVEISPPCVLLVFCFIGVPSGFLLGKLPLSFFTLKGNFVKETDKWSDVSIQKRDIESSSFKKGLI